MYFYEHSADDGLSKHNIDPKETAKILNLPAKISLRAIDLSLNKLLNTNLNKIFHADKTITVNNPLTLQWYGEITHENIHKGLLVSNAYAGLWIPSYVEWSLAKLNLHIRNITNISEEDNIDKIVEKTLDQAIQTDVMFEKFDVLKNMSGDMVMTPEKKVTREENAYFMKKRVKLVRAMGHTSDIFPKDILEIKVPELKDIFETLKVLNALCTTFFKVIPTITDSGPISVTRDKVIDAMEKVARQTKTLEELEKWSNETVKKFTDDLNADYLSPLVALTKHLISVVDAATTYCDNAIKVYEE